MKLNKITTILTGAAAAIMMLSACNDDVEMRYPPREPLPDLPEITDIHTYKAPLYWSVYEYCIDLEKQGVGTIDITAEQWEEWLTWIEQELLPYGYDMVCTDGFCAMVAEGEDGYMDRYGSVKLADLVAMCKAHGLKLGVYDNPLWLHRIDGTKVEGTDRTFESLKANGTETVRHPGAEDKWFTWVVAEHPGAKEYIDGFFKHYKEMGVDYIRMDFLSWYEDGWDRNMNGIVGKGYGRASYARALCYIAEAAKKYGIFTSLVMPHLYDNAIVEAQYGNMVRIVSDTDNGGWKHTSADSKGQSYATWPNCKNQFDGFVYWNHISGRDRVILDGDFIRINRYETDAEKEFAVSLQLIAGGPVTPSDLPTAIRPEDIRFYTNTEMLALNADRFVGRPLSNSLTNQDNQIWWGRMSDGTPIVALFNRNDAPATKSVQFSTLGLEGKWNLRDLWTHTDEGLASGITATIPAHGCKVVKLTKPE